MAEKKEKQYVSDNAQLMAEWDWEKNDEAGYDPTKVTVGSHQIVWWKCEKGHGWSTAPMKRYIGQNCPFCSGKKAWKGYNDLATTNPELVPEWDWKKNDVPIYMYRPMSNKKTWWVCDKGHSWDAVIAKRVQGEKCPFCQGKKILAGFNDLATTHPYLVEEWDFEKNKDVLPTAISKGSEKKVWWKCSRGHSWSASVYSRVSGVGCSRCFKELQSSFPEKAIYFYIKRIFPDAIANYHSSKMGSLELDIFIPSLKIGIEYDGERWHQKTEKDLLKNRLCNEAGIVLIRVREPSCPTLSDNLSICIIRDNKKTGLENTIKSLLVKLSEFVDSNFTMDVNLERDNTIILELLTSLEKENNICFQNSKLLDEWDYERNGNLLPSMVTAGSDKKVWWTCSQGHHYKASVASKTRGRGCSVCSGKQVLKGFNDFECRCPELAKSWDYTKNDITPDMVTYGSDEKFWWLCSKGHSYQCSINNRRYGQGCPFCSNKKILVGFNDINTTHPQIVFEWDYENNEIKPTDVSAGSHKQAWWRCSLCGHTWLSPIYTRTSGGGCPECAKARRKNGKV